MTKQDIEIKFPWMLATGRLLATAFLAAITTAWAVRGYFADATLKQAADLSETRRTLAVHDAELTQIIVSERDHFLDLKSEISELRRAMMRNGYANKGVEP